MEASSSPDAKRARISSSGDTKGEGGNSRYIATRAKELALEAGCQHTFPLVTFKEDSDAAQTCGQHQASLLANVDMQTIYERQVELDGDPGYCLARRLRNQVYYDTSTDLGAVGAGNQCAAGDCMLAALKMFAGKKMAGIPKEIVSALCKY